jgi:hypothetical protein
MMSDLVQIRSASEPEPIRVFPGRTPWTPDDPMAFVGYPPLFRPGTPDTPVLVSVVFKWQRQRNVGGCRGGELRASAESAEAAIFSPPIQKPNTKPQSKWRDLGALASPPFQVLTRLKKETAQYERESAVAAINARDPDAFTTPSLASLLSSLSVSNVSEKSARKGPFCRVTCAAHHGGVYDVESLPELCRANWIPKTYLVPGWYSVSDKEEITYAWPGPAYPGFENYKLYWSGVQSEAKVIHSSNQQ